MATSRWLSSLMIGGTLALVACGEQSPTAITPSSPIVASAPLASIDASSCTAGSYFDGTSCVPAAPGYFVPVDGATEQTPCPPGSYQDERGATSCKLAPVGSFVLYYGSAIAYRCQAGMTTLAPGTISGLDCVWVTFGGFSAPLDPTVVNVAKAGSAIPVKFSMAEGYLGLYILATGSPTSVDVPCTGGETTAAPEETSTAGASTLTYDATTGEYKYVWKTEKGWARTCRRLSLTLSNGQVETLDFQFTR